MQNLFSKNNDRCIIDGDALCCGIKLKVRGSRDVSTYNIVFKPYLQSWDNGNKISFGLKVIHLPMTVTTVKISYNIHIPAIDYYEHFSPMFMSINNEFGGLNQYEGVRFDFNAQQINKMTENGLCIKIAIMTHALQEVLDDKLKNIYIYNTSEQEEIPSNLVIQETAPIPNSWIKCLSIFYGLSNSLFFAIDQISDYYILYLWTYYLQFNTEHLRENPLLLIWILSAVDLIGVQLLYAYRFYNKHLDHETENVWMYWIGVILIFILSPLLPLFEAFTRMHFILNKINIYNIFITLKIPIIKNETSDVLISANQDEVRTWLKSYMEHNHLIFLQVVFESSIQATLQTVAFMIIVTTYGGLSQYDMFVTILSILLSLITLISKLLPKSYSIHKMNIFFNFICWSADIFGFFSIIYCLSYLYTINDQFGIKLFTYSLLFQIVITALQCIMTSSTFPSNQFGFMLGLLPIRILIKSILKLAYFPLLIFHELENAENEDQFRYFNDVITWIHEYEHDIEYNQRLIIANQFIAKTYNDNKEGDTETEDLHCFAERNDDIDLLNITPKQIRDQVPMMSIGYYLNKILQRIYYFSITGTNYDTKPIQIQQNAFIKIIFPNAYAYRHIIKMVNTMYLSVQFLYILYPILFLIYQCIRFQSSEFDINYGTAIFPFLFCCLYLLLLILLIVYWFRIYKKVHTTFHLYPLRIGKHYPYQSDYISKLEQMRKMLFEKEMKYLAKMSDDDLSVEKSKSKSSIEIVQSSEV